MGMLIRRAGERGKADFGWLKSQHTFSFGSYFDPRHMGFGDLRVINEDKVTPSKGFSTHPHDNMEIISYVLEGELEHKDTMGNVARIIPGEVQLMSAGTGVAHSEYNGSNKDLVHFFQIWIHPKERNTEPRYDQKMFADEEKKNRWRLLVSEDGRDGSLRIGQDARLYGTLLDKGTELNHLVEAGKKIWIQVARGSVKLQGEEMKAGDGAALADEREIQLLATEDAELLMFELTD